MLKMIYDITFTTSCFFFKCPFFKYTVFSANHESLERGHAFCRQLYVFAWRIHRMAKVHTRVGPMENQVRPTIRRKKKQKKNTFLKKIRMLL